MTSVSSLFLRGSSLGFFFLGAGGQMAGASVCVCTDDG
jgi:hypothetical protein